MLAACDKVQVPCPPPAVELHLLDDASIGVANRRCLGCTGPTNVLSFPGGSDTPGTLLFSLDTLHRECLLYGQEPAEHALRLLAHGMAHLCGLDHSEQMDMVSQFFMDAGPLRLLPDQNQRAHRAFKTAARTARQPVCAGPQGPYTAFRAACGQILRHGYAILPADARR